MGSYERLLSIGMPRQDLRRALLKVAKDMRREIQSRGACDLGSTWGPARITHREALMQAIRLESWTTGMD
jgi:hypothetical protein